ncbi:MAG: nitroreductase family deazaflavin-dependent oxidoreductase [Actinomycetota bacterium]|nr:nitroreductase family deazaflavin-dependent oxidoreductase [Actinomycetota bacterium]
MTFRTLAGVAVRFDSRVRDQREARLQNLGAKVPFFGRAVPRLHARLYRRLQGRFVGRWLGGPVMVLETVGRRSGKPRATPVIYAWDGDDLIVVAANAGNPRPPAWWLNLEAQPRAHVVMGGERRAVRARRAEGEERERRLRVYERVYPKVHDYRAFTEREFPVIVLEPTD